MKPEDLGPLPPHRHSLNSGAFLPLYTADQMRAERQRCYELGRAAERERWQIWVCRREWDNVNDPPCHPGDEEWKPCAACIGPGAQK